MGSDNKNDAGIRACHARPATWTAQTVVTRLLHLFHEYKSAYAAKHRDLKVAEQYGTGISSPKSTKQVKSRGAEMRGNDWLTGAAHINCANKSQRLICGLWRWLP